MTGILIDPKAREIREVEIEKDENGSYLTAMYRELDCELVDAAPEVMCLKRLSAFGVGWISSC